MCWLREPLQEEIGLLLLKRWYQLFTDSNNGAEFLDRGSEQVYGTQVRTQHKSWKGWQCIKKCCTMSTRSDSCFRDATKTQLGSKRQANNCFFVIPLVFLVVRLFATSWLKGCLQKDVSFTKGSAYKLRSHRRSGGCVYMYINGKYVIRCGCYWCCLFLSPPWEKQTSIFTKCEAATT